MDTGLRALKGSILKLHASIVSVRDPPWLHFEPLKLLNVYFNAIPIWIHIQFFTLMRIHIPLPKIMQIHADLNPQPCLFQHALVENNLNSYSCYSVCIVILVTVLFLSVLCRGEEDDSTALERGCRALSSLAHHSHARRCHQTIRVKKKNKLFTFSPKLLSKIYQSKVTYTFFKD